MNRASIKRLLTSFFGLSLLFVYIASPDVRIDHENQRLVMYAHGRDAGRQLTRVALSEDGLSNFEAGPRFFSHNMRHSALLIRDNMLHVFWTQAGHAPERVNQLRDPAIYEEDGQYYLPYSVARLDFN